MPMQLLSLCMWKQMMVKINSLYWTEGVGQFLLAQLTVHQLPEQIKKRSDCTKNGSEIARYKTVLCRYAASGAKCREGKRCKFAHSSLEVRNYTDPVPYFAKRLYSEREVEHAEDEWDEEVIEWASDDYKYSFAPVNEKKQNKLPTISNSKLEFKFDCQPEVSKSITKQYKGEYREDWKLELDALETATTKHSETYGSDHRGSQFSQENEKPIEIQRSEGFEEERRQSQQISSHLLDQLVISDGNSSVEKLRLIDTITELKTKKDEFWAFACKVASNLRKSNNERSGLKKMLSISRNDVCERDIEIERLKLEKAASFFTGPYTELQNFVNSILQKLENEIQCPLSTGNLKVPVILPSGVTVNESVMSRLIRDKERDPYDSKNICSKFIHNKIASKIIDLIKQLKKDKSDFESSISNEKISNDEIITYHEKCLNLTEKVAELGKQVTSLTAQEIIKDKTIKGLKSSVRDKNSNLKSKNEKIKDYSTQIKDFKDQIVLKDLQIDFMQNEISDYTHQLETRDAKIKKLEMQVKAQEYLEFQKQRCQSSGLPLDTSEYRTLGETLSKVINYGP